MVEQEATGALHRVAPPATIAQWMGGQRWFANKGAVPALEQIGCWVLDSANPDVLIATHLYIDHTIGKPALYQVPLTYRRFADHALDHALVGVTDDDEPWHVYDGPHDPSYARALLAFITDDGAADGERMHIEGYDTGGAVAAGLRSRVLTGEQSNTSIIFESDDAAARPVICKVFRALHHGENPDVELQSALAAAGSTTVPHPIGHITAEWDDKGEATGRARGNLAFAQEFLPSAEDAWRLALRSAAAGENFDASASGLGAATADVHATLATALPASPSTPAEIAGVLTQMRGRLARAVSEVPSLADHLEAIEAVFARAITVPWPPQQRIHGDLHLGQVLGIDGAHGERAWVLVDFEGEPLRPMHERSRLDFALRDVAGMLRSFDYVAGALAEAVPPVDVEAWVASAREAFLDGYSARSGSDVRANHALLDAFELDKALYEVVYEARNRPDWVRIPVAAIERLVAR
ncbi:MAG: phosphotransferase [Rhodoglobus sp.]